MEGNILGFFGFPILILASIFQLIGMWPMLSLELWPLIEKTYQPLIEVFSELTLVKQVFILVIFNPVFIFCYRQFAYQEGNLFLNLFGGFIAGLITIGIILLCWIIFVWLLSFLSSAHSGFGAFIMEYFKSWTTMRLLMATFSALGFFLFFLNVITQNKIQVIFDSILIFTFLIMFGVEGQFLYTLFKK